MNETIKKNCEDLVYVLRAGDTLRSEILAAPVASIVETLSEVILNILYGDLKAEEPEEKEFIQQKRLLKKIAEDNQSISERTKLVNKIRPDILNAIKTLLERYV